MPLCLGQDTIHKCPDCIDFTEVEEKMIFSLQLRAVSVSRHTLEWKHNVQMLRWIERLIRERHSRPKRPKMHIMITSTDRPLAAAQQTPDNITNAPAYLFRAARMCSQTNLGTPDTVRWRQRRCVRIVVESLF